MNSLYLHMKEEKIKNLLFISIQNNDYEFTFELFQSIEKTDIALYKKIFEWLLLGCLEQDNTVLFAFLHETFPLQLYRFFVHRPSLQTTNKIIPHLTLFCVEYEKYNILEYMIQNDACMFQIDYLFHEIIDKFIQDKNYKGLMSMLEYYYTHKDIILFSLRYAYNTNCRQHIDNEYDNDLDFNTYAKRILSLAFKYFQYSIFDIIHQHEDILNNHLDALEFIFSFKSTDTFYFLNKLLQKEWTEEHQDFFIHNCIHHDNHILLNWYLHNFDITNKENLYFELLYFDAWKCMNLIIDTPIGNSLDQFMQNHIEILLVENNGNGVDILSHIVNNGTIDLNVNIQGMNVLEYALLSKEYKTAKVLLSNPLRNPYSIHPNYIHVYFSHPFLFPFFIKEEIIELFKLTYGEFYNYLPEYMQKIYETEYRELELNIIEKSLNEDEPCIICRENPMKFFLCKNNIKQHIICIQCHFKVEIDNCCLCKEFEVDVDTLYKNTNQEKTE